MARRQAYTELQKQGQDRPAYVTGQKIYRAIYCLGKGCKQFFFLREADTEGQFTFSCPHCGHRYSATGSEHLFNYSLMDLTTNREISGGRFNLTHAEYVRSAPRYKYCLLCYALKPLSDFSAHASMASGYQGECKICKTKYNTVKNPTRLTEQHQEASQRRRLLRIIANMETANPKELFRRYDNKCFNCGIALDRMKRSTWHADHTLPIYFLWPMDATNATLLCDKCNGKKNRRWPSQFYKKQQLTALSAKTGIPFDVLAGKPTYNPEALAFLSTPANVEQLYIEQKYHRQINDLRNRILVDTGADILDECHGLSAQIRRDADALLISKKGRRTGVD